MQRPATTRRNMQPKARARAIRTMKIVRRWPPDGLLEKVYQKGKQGVEHTLWSK